MDEPNKPLTEAEKSLMVALRESMNTGGGDFRRPDYYESIRTVENRVTALETGQTQLRSDLAANTRVTSSIKEDTEDLVEFTKAAKGLVTFAKWAAALLKWASIVAGSIAGLWLAVKGWRG